MATLGGLLYSNWQKPLVLETEWVALLDAIVAGDHAALHAVYALAHRPVYTYLLRITGNQEMAENLTLELFHDVWRNAALHDPAKSTVLCWVMNRALALAIEHGSGNAGVAPQANFPDDPAVRTPDILEPPAALQLRLSRLIGDDAAAPIAPASKTDWQAMWQEVAPGIMCQLLATDSERNRVSMLVRLLPGIQYPSHTHAAREELHLLHGELWIEDRKLRAGDYHRAEANTRDRRVWSATGCSCVLHTSTLDTLH